MKHRLSSNTSMKVKQKQCVECKEPSSRHMFLLRGGFFCSHCTCVRCNNNCDNHPRLSVGCETLLMAGRQVSPFSATHLPSWRGWSSCRFLPQFYLLRKTSDSLGQNSCWSSLYMFVTFCNIVLMPLLPPIYLHSCFPHPCTYSCFSPTVFCCLFSYFTWRWFDDFYYFHYFL